MAEFSVRDVFLRSFSSFEQSHVISSAQHSAASSILGCKTGAFGLNAQICDDCSHIQIHYCSCGNRNCPSCQQIQKEKWIDQRRAEVIDTPYFHVVFTVPSQLRSLILANQVLLYDLLHQAASTTILTLSMDEKHLGATPGIIQILHTWTQTLEYHPHIHCIVSGGGLTRDLKLKKSSSHFFLPVAKMMPKFRGFFLANLKQYYYSGKLTIPSSCQELNETALWKEYLNQLYTTDWCPFVKETFNGFGNAIDYLGRYTHRIAISNQRILSVSDTHTTFWYYDRKDGNTRKEMTLDNQEFIRRFLMHVLPKGYRKIRYYGFLNNRFKKKNLKILFSLQSKQPYAARFSKDTSALQVIKELWKVNSYCCPMCGSSMRSLMKHSRLRS